MKKIITLFWIASFLTFPTLIYPAADSVPLFSPAIDGLKEAGWGSTSTADSTGQRQLLSANPVGTYHDDDACREVYITDDPDYLYIGYYYNGDAWATPNPSARIMFGFITNDAGTTGGSTDPWLSSTTFASGNRPDFFLRQWTEAPYDERMEFGPALGYSSYTKGVAEFLRWDGAYWSGAGSIIHYERLTANSTVQDGNFKIFFYNSGGWAQPRLHVWDVTTSGPSSLTNTGWPGHIMNNEGDGWYSVTFDNNATGCWFCFSDNGASTTSDQIAENVGPKWLWYVQGEDTLYGSDPDATVANNWGEIAIPLDSMGLETGDTVKIFMYYRPNDSAAGFSDSVPYDANCSLNGATAAEFGSSFTYTVRADNIAPALDNFNPAHTDTDIAKDAAVTFRVIDNVAFVSSVIDVIIEGNDAIIAGIFQPGYSGSIVQNNSTNYSVSITADGEYEYNQRVNVEINVSDAAGNTAQKIYYFDVEPDTTAPTFSSLSPAHLATGVARNTTVQYTVGDDDQVNQSSIKTTVNGVLALQNNTFQAGFAGSSSQILMNGAANGYNVTIDPETDFDFDEVVIVTNIASDVAGNAKTNVTRFTVRPDDVLPTLTGASPYAGEVNKAPTVNISFLLNDNIGVISNTIQVKINNTNAVLNGGMQTGYSGSIVPSGNGYSVTVDPQFGLAFSSTVSVWVQAKDAQNNTVTSNWTFNIKDDEIQPVLSGLIPAANATNQPRNVNIFFMIDDETSVDDNTLDVTVNGADAVVDGSSQAGFNYSFIATNNGIRCTINPDNDFLYEQTVAVNIYVEDNSGNPLTAAYNFTIKADDVSPYARNLSPTSGETGVAIDKNIAFSVTDDSDLDNSTLVALINGVTALSNGEFLSPYNGNLSAMNNSQSNISVVIDPTFNWQYRSNYTITLSVDDGTGNNLSTNYTFTIRPDDVPPYLTNLSPAKDAVQVDNDTDISLDILDNIKVSSNSIVVKLITNNMTNLCYSNNTFLNGYSGSIVAKSGGYQLAIIPPGTFNFNEFVRIRVSARDGENNALSDTWTFTIQSGDATLPTLSKQNPYNGQDEVEPDTMIYFETADNVGVASNSINVSVQFPGGAVSTAISNGAFQEPFDGALSSIKTNDFKGFDITIDYSGTFGFTNTYGVTARIADETPNWITNSWSFSIRPPDTTPPSIIQLQPTNGQEDVPIATTISFISIDNYGIRSNDVTVWMDSDCVLSNGVFLGGFKGSGSSLSGNDKNGQNVIIDPESDLPYGQEITVIITLLDTSTNLYSITNTFKPQALEQAVATTSMIDPKRNVDAVKVKVNRTGYAKANIYNIRGELVATIPEEYYNIGDFIEWDGSLLNTGETVGSGWYFITLTGSDINTTVKVMVIN